MLIKAHTAGTASKHINKDPAETSFTYGKTQRPGLDPKTTARLKSAARKAAKTRIRHMFTERHSCRVVSSVLPGLFRGKEGHPLSLSER